MHSEISLTNNLDALQTNNSMNYRDALQTSLSGNLTGKKTLRELYNNNLKSYPEKNSINLESVKSKFDLDNLPDLNLGDLSNLSDLNLAHLSNLSDLNLGDLSNLSDLNLGDLSNLANQKLNLSHVNSPNTTFKNNLEEKEKRGEKVEINDDSKKHTLISKMDLDNKNLDDKSIKIDIHDNDTKSQNINLGNDYLKYIEDDSDIREEVLQKLVKPEYFKNVQDGLFWRDKWRNISNVCLAISKLLAVIGTTLAFASGFWNYQTLAFISGAFCTLGLGMGEYSSFAIKASVDQTDNVNRVLEKLRIRQVPNVVIDNFLDSKPKET
jgi:hypothetical protein